jgi:ABC-2 type transport system ATP-binding protein
LNSFAIEIQNLTKDHAGEKALRGITLNIPSPCLFGIIGADGAGKSTLMNILSTLMDADSGEGKILGRNLKTDFQSIRADIGYMPQRFSLYQDLSVEENLNFFADIFGILGREKNDRMQHLLQFAGLQNFTKRRAGLLSGGMKQKLALACTLIHQPKLILLDEPTVGVDPVARRDFWILLKSLRDEGITLIVSTPYMDEAALCDRLMLLHSGTILSQGTPAQMLEDYPYQLYRIDPIEIISEASMEKKIGLAPSREQTLTYPGDTPPPEGFALIYPSGGSLHAAEFKNKTFSSPTLQRVQAAVPRAGLSTPIAPVLEDCFFSLLHHQIEADTLMAEKKP